MATVGLVGGLGPESTIDYYRRLLAAWTQIDPGGAPSIVIDSLDVQRALRLVESDRAGLVEYLLASLHRLAGAGVDFAALTANTPHIVFDELSARSPVALLSIVESCAAAAKSRGLRRLALLGTRFTMDAPFYPDVFARHGLGIVSLADADRVWLHDCYVNELLAGVFRDESRERVTALVARLRDEQRIDGVILGGTELPLLLKADDIAGVPALDTTALHVGAIVSRLRPPLPAIRRATPADSDLLADIGRETFHDTFAPDNTADDMAQYLGRAFGPGRQAEELADPSSAFLIAELGTTPVGYARLRWATTHNVVPGTRLLEIARFYVRRPWLGCGIGAALMRACFDEARRSGCDVVWLGVWERNLRALAFYEKWGFVIVGQQVFQLGADLQRDVIMMRRTTAGEAASA